MLWTLAAPGRDLRRLRTHRNARLADLPLVERDALADDVPGRCPDGVWALPSGGPEGLGDSSSPRRSRP